MMLLDIFILLYANVFVTGLNHETALLVKFIIFSGRIVEAIVNMTESS